MDNRSLSHTRWKCQYHIVFIPKYRKRILYGRLREDVKEIIRLFLSSQTLDFRKNTPAYAGNTSDPSSTIPVFRDHPRLRGEYGRLPVPLIVPVGSPPLARGIHARNKGIRDRIRITPACAGNTFQYLPRLHRQRDHPRLRGEYRL